MDRTHASSRVRSNLSCTCLGGPDSSSTPGHLRGSSLRPILAFQASALPEVLSECPSETLGEM